MTARMCLACDGACGGSHLLNNDVCRGRQSVNTRLHQLYLEELLGELIAALARIS